MSGAVLAVDPGREKCGVAVLAADGTVLLQEVVPTAQLVDEYRTTDEAKAAYWTAHPPRGWRRLIPRGMLVPPVPVDDFVAVILAQRYLTEVR